MSDTPPDRPGGLEWLGVVLLVLSGSLSGFLECLLVPLYAGSVIVPISVVLAVVGNVALPRMARALVPNAIVTLAPFAAWLIVVVAFGLLARPEGDVILPGSPTSAVWTTYGFALGGAVAGIATAVLTMPPPAQRKDVTRAR